MMKHIIIIAAIFYLSGCDTNFNRCGNVKSYDHGVLIFNGNVCRINENTFGSGCDFENKDGNPISLPSCIIKYNKGMM